MAWDSSKPAGTDSANTIDNTVQANFSALDTWASAFTDGVAAGSGTVLRALRAANATILALRSDAGDTVDRYHLDLNGKMEWGSGAAAVDASLQRTGTSAIAFNLTNAAGSFGVAINSVTTFFNNATRTQYTQASARVTKTGTQSVASGSDVALTWDSETWDTDTLHDNAVNNSRLTAQVAGKYLVGAYVRRLDATTIGTWEVKVRKNGTTIYLRDSQDTASVNANAISVSTLVDLAASGYVEALVNHSDSANIAVQTDSAFWMVFVGL